MSSGVDRNRLVVEAAVRLLSGEPVVDYAFASVQEADDYFEAICESLILFGATGESSER